MDSVKEIQDKLKKLEDRRVDLDRRFDQDFALYCIEEFKFEDDEGKWDVVTSNRARVEADKNINYLAYADRSIYIFNKDEDRRGRTKIQATEKLVNGAFYANSTMTDGMPEQPEFELSASFYRIVRGWGCYRPYVYEDENGETIFDIPVWDIRNTYYISGSQRLLFVINSRWDTEDSIKDLYPGWNGKADPTLQLVRIDNVFQVEAGKEAEEAVIIDEEFVQEPEGIGLDYIPVRIKAGNSVPYIVAKNNSSLRHIGESWFAANRNLYTKESRVLSYNMTRAGILAKAPVVLTTNAQKVGGKPREIEGAPNSKGAVVTLDAGLEEKLEVLNMTAPGQNINEVMAQLQQKLSEGGASNVAFGTPPYPDTAEATQLMTHETLSKIQPFKIALEKDYAWIASEIASQFKNGEFSKQRVYGLDSRFQRFDANVSPEDIVTDRKFECKLIPDILRDKTLNAGIAIQLTDKGIISRREARDEFQLVKNPDMTEELIAQETVEQITTPLMGSLKMLLDAAKDNSPTGRLQYTAATLLLNTQIQQMQQTMNPQQTPQGPQGQVQPGMTQPMPPQAATGGMQSIGQVPPDIQQAVRARMGAANAR